MSKKSNFHPCLLTGYDKSAFKLYINLATKTQNKGLQNLFLQLAQEESKHKLMFEIEYDEVILKEN